MIRQLKWKLQAALRQRGIDVRKAPAAFEPIPVFRLAVEALMARRGDGLRFVQVGANDGLFGDPLRPYILSRGWSGILIEPQIDVFARLKANYAECADRLVFENLAISCDDKLTLYLPPADLAESRLVYAQSIVSSDPAVIARQMGIAEAQLRRIDVPAMTLNALFEKHAIAALDLLQIDAEGYDWEVLQTLDLGRVAPAIIQLETGHMGRRDISAMAAHLNQAGYLIYYGGWQGDTLAMRRELFDHA